MIRLYDTGAYLVHGTDVTIADDRDAAAKLKQAVGGHIPSREEAAKETMAYSYFAGSQHIRKYGEAADPF